MIGDESGASWLGLSPAAWAALAVGLHLVLGLALYDPTLFTGGDNAGYMILGDALRSGAGYRDLHLPGTPLHTKYPPGYPAALAVLGVFGGLHVYKLFSLACTALSVWLVYRIGRRLFSPAAGASAAVLFALNPVLLEYSHWVLSEPPFVAAVLLSLAAACALGRDDGEERGGRKPGPWAWALAAGGAAFLVRTAGLPLLLALAAYPALRRERGRAAGAVGAALALAGGWFLYGQLAGGGEAGYLQQLLMENPYDPAAGTVGAAGLLERTATNLWTYAAAVLPGALTGESYAGPRGGSAPATAFGLAVTALALSGWLLRGRREIAPTELFTLLYVGLIAVWPSVWTDRRFLLPVLPLLLVYAVGALRAAGRRWLPAEGRGAAAAVTGGLLLALPAGASAADRLPRSVRCLSAYTAGEPCTPPPWRSFYRAAEWAGENLPEGAVVSNRKPRIFYWISGHRGDVYRYTREPSLLLRGLDEMGATHVVVDRVSGTTARYLVPAVRQRSARFRMLYRGGDPPTFLLRYLPEPDRAAAPGGTELARRGARQP